LEGGQTLGQGRNPALALCNKSVQAMIASAMGFLARLANGEEFMEIPVPLKNNIIDIQITNTPPSGIGENLDPNNHPVAFEATKVV